MNRESILDLFLSALSGIDMHPRFMEELVKEITGSGYEDRLLKLLVVRLNYLRKTGPCCRMSEYFEQINKDIYSMRLSHKSFNLRILFSFLPDNSPTLLLFFFERSKKKNTDYSKHLGPAGLRLQNRLKEYENE